jgi:hypothetical protein
MEKATLANIFLKAVEAILRQLDAVKKHRIHIEEDQIKRIGNYLERISVTLSEAAKAFEKGSIPYEQCAELESSMGDAVVIVQQLSKRLADGEIITLLERLRGGVSAPGVLADLILEQQQKSLLIYFHRPEAGEEPTTFKDELSALQTAAGCFRGAAEKVRLNA